MRYNINARLIYDATDGTLTLPEAMNRTASCLSPPARCSTISCAIPMWSAAMSTEKSLG
jgi:hypothetical protein